MKYKVKKAYLLFIIAFSVYVDIFAMYYVRISNYLFQQLTQYVSRVLTAVYVLSMFLIHAAQIAKNYCYLFQSIKNLCKTVDVKNVRPKLLYTLKSSTCHARYRRIFSFTKANFFFNFCIRPKVIEKNLWRKNQSFDETASITKLRVANQLTLDERYCKTIND